jgi:ATP-dependent 26S proteasome regulatory subunit
MIAQERSAGSHNWLVGDLLNLLDGIEDRDDVGIILTSNSWAFLEKALVDRPGRIDHIVRYKGPTDAHRVHLLRSFTQEMTLEVEDDDIISLTAGLTPAQLRELVKRATVLSLQRAGTGSWSRVLSCEDLERGAASLCQGQDTRRTRRIGLGNLMPGTRG